MSADQLSAAVVQLSSAAHVVSGASRMPAAVLAATLVAAVAHATWNAIAHWIPDKLVSMTLVSIGGLICGVPLVFVARMPDTRCWGYLLASVALHVVYNTLLMVSYRFGDLSQTYPLARGTSPLVVTLLAAVFVGERPSAGQLAGVLLISAGLVWLVLWGRRDHPGSRAAVIAAIATGLMIASYTTTDGLGVRSAGSTLGYIGWLMTLESCAVPAAAFAIRGRKLLTRARPVWPLGLAGGALSVLAYGLVLWAQTRSALADVAALRESSIIIGALIGALVFGERFGAARIPATVAVVAGIAVIYLV